MRTDHSTQHLAALMGERRTVSIVGLNALGMATAAELVALGHEIVGTDRSRDAVRHLSNGVSGHDNALVDLPLSRAAASGAIGATMDTPCAVADSSVTFVCLEPGADETLDRTDFDRALALVAEGFARKGGFHVVVLRADIPLAMMADHIVPLLEAQSGRTSGRDFGVVLAPTRDARPEAAGLAPPFAVAHATDGYADLLASQLYAPANDSALHAALTTTRRSQGSAGDPAALDADVSFLDNGDITARPLPVASRETCPQQG